jgi:hypothetical protein
VNFFDSSDPNNISVGMVRKPDYEFKGGQRELVSFINVKRDIFVYDDRKTVDNGYGSWWNGSNIDFVCPDNYFLAGIVW